MDAEDPKTEIEKRLAELPQNIRDAVLSAELSEHVHTIGQRHNLHIDQIATLEDETMLVMLGFFELDKFNEQIEAQLNLSPLDAAAIADDINHEIFMPIRASLIEFAEHKQAEAAHTQSQPAPLATDLPMVQQPRPVPMTTISPMAKPPQIPTPAQVPTQPLAHPSPAPVPPPPPSMPVAVGESAPSTEEMLTQKTATNPIYKADPYREPVE